MRKGIIAFTLLVLGLIIPCAIQTSSVAAQSSPSICIQKDGTVTPPTAFIQQIGDTYKLVADINDPLIVEKNNIVLDGQGFTVQGSGATNNQAAISLKCTGVTVENFRVIGWQVGILGVYDSNRIVNNYILGNNYDVSIYASNYQVTGNKVGSERVVGNNNVFSGNKIVIRGYMSGFWISNSSGTIIEANNITLAQQATTFISTDNGDFQVYHNNFLNIEENTGGAFLFIISYPKPTTDASPYWDNGFPSGGNYWSDYASRYPNATEIGNSGIGDTAYVNSLAPSVVDRYPLMIPYNASKPMVAAQPTPSHTQNVTPTPSVPEYPVWIALLLFIAILLAAFFFNRKNFRKPAGAFAASFQRMFVCNYSFFAPLNAGFFTASFLCFYCFFRAD